MRRFAHGRTHEVVLRLAKESLSPGARVLDAGCGEGALTRPLAEAGYLLTAVDVDAGRLRLVPRPAVRADLDRPLPFADASFDAVVVVETLEHLWNHHLFLTEAARVTREGGLLLLTMPNVLNLASRLRFLLTGYPSIYSPRRLDADHRRRHVNILPLPVLDAGLTAAGWRLERVATDRVRRGALLLAPLAPLGRAAATLLRCRDPRTSSPNVLFGRSLVALARRARRAGETKRSSETRT